MTETNSTGKVLVIGGTGHYGRYIVQALLNRGEKIGTLNNRLATESGEKRGEGMVLSLSRNFSN